MATNKAEFTVETAALFREIARNFSAGTGTDSAGIVIGLDQIRVGLARIANRAVELGDPELLRECERLCLVRKSAAGRKNDA